MSRNFCMYFGRVRVSHEAIKIAQSCEFFGNSRFLPHFRCFSSFSLVSRELFRWPALVLYILRGARQLKKSFRVKTTEIKRAVGPLHEFATNYVCFAIFAFLMVSGNVSAYFLTETRTMADILPPKVCRGWCGRVRGSSMAMQGAKPAKRWTRRSFCGSAGCSFSRFCEPKFCEIVVGPRQTTFSMMDASTLFPEALTGKSDCDYNYMTLS